MSHNRSKPIEHRITVGNTRTPLFMVLEQSGKPVDLTSKTAKFTMRTNAGTAIVDEGTAGVTQHPTQTFTASASTSRLTANDHRVQENDQIVVSTTTTLPSGLAASTRYFARDVTKNTFRLSSVEGEAAITIADAGTGTHSFYIVGSVQYDFQTADVAAGYAGRNPAWWTLYDGSEWDTFPPDGRTMFVVIEKAI